MAHGADDPPARVSARRQDRHLTMDWIREHYDRSTLIAAAVFLLISTVLIWWSVIQFGSNLIALQRPAVPPKAASPPGEAVELDRAALQLDHPAQWKTSGRSGLF